MAHSSLYLLLEKLCLKLMCVCIQIPFLLPSFTLLALLRFRSAVNLGMGLSAVLSCEGMLSHSGVR